jgi:hypothetical protein
LAPEEVQQGIIQLVNLELKGEVVKKKEEAQDKVKKYIKNF